MSSPRLLSNTTGVLCLWVGALVLAVALAQGWHEKNLQNISFGQGQVTFYPEGAPPVVLRVDVATTPEAQARGLMFRQHLADDEGMLFLFHQPAMQTFWMKNTPLSLDIIFVGSDGRIINIAAHTTPESEQTYASLAPATAVVEVRAGLAARWGIGPGTRVGYGLGH
ncbi:MAG: DUF192 domain-containing protein [Alphaproteobacteria bacterium]|nr:DUF192 domain-containing protein [Alphaproteobacteria bacterium]